MADFNSRLSRTGRALPPYELWKSTVEVDIETIEKNNHATCNNEDKGKEGDQNEEAVVVVNENVLYQNELPCSTTIQGPNETYTVVQKSVIERKVEEVRCDLKEAVYCNIEESVNTNAKKRSLVDFEEDVDCSGYLEGEEEVELVEIIDADLLEDDVVYVNDEVVDVIEKLNGVIERNSEVMKQALETICKTADDMNEIQKNGDYTIPDIKRSDKMTVQVRCTFLKICEIDTINQQYEADIFVQARWQEPLIPDIPGGTAGKDVDEVYRLIPWVPKMIVMNIDGSFLHNRKTFDVRFNEPGCAYPMVVLLWRFKGFFKETLELEHFPVDLQELTISLSTERSDKEVNLVPDRKEQSSINTKGFTDQEWTMFEHVETVKDFTTEEYCSSTIHPIFHAICRVHRKIGYFLWNIIFIMMLINTLTFSAYTVKSDNAGRLTVTITLFLTAVAFKLVVKQSLPTISYLTYLDVYVIASLIFLSIQAVENATMAALYSFKDAAYVDDLDDFLMLATALLLIVFHILFAVFIFFTAAKRSNLMKDKDRLYKINREYLRQHGKLPRIKRINYT